LTVTYLVDCLERRRFYLWLACMHARISICTHSYTHIHTHIRECSTFLYGVRPVEFIFSKANIYSIYNNEEHYFYSPNKLKKSKLH
jgi:hypothetical protein